MSTADNKHGRIRSSLIRKYDGLDGADDYACPLFGDDLYLMIAFHKVTFRDDIHHKVAHLDLPARTQR